MSNTELFMLKNLGTNGEYRVYRCDKHGLYMKRNDLPIEDNKCVYKDCLSENEQLSSQTIQNILKSN